MPCFSELGVGTKQLPPVETVQLVIILKSSEKGVSKYLRAGGTREWLIISCLDKKQKRWVQSNKQLYVEYAGYHVEGAKDVSLLSGAAGI